MLGLSQTGPRRTMDVQGTAVSQKQGVVQKRDNGIPCVGSPNVGEHVGDVGSGYAPGRGCCMWSSGWRVVRRSGYGSCWEQWWVLGGVVGRCGVGCWWVWWWVVGDLDCGVPVFKKVGNALV